MCDVSVGFRVFSVVWCRTNRYSTDLVRFILLFVGCFQFGAETPDILQMLRGLRWFFVGFREFGKTAFSSADFARVPFVFAGCLEFGGKPFDLLAIFRGVRGFWLVFFSLWQCRSIF